MRTKKNPEIPMVPKAHLKTIEHQRDQLFNDNERLMRRNQKLEAYVRMWDKIKDWKKKELEKDSNNYLLHDLSDKMNRLERDMYKGRDK